MAHERPIILSPRPPTAWRSRQAAAAPCRRLAVGVLVFLLNASGTSSGAEHYAPPAETVQPQVLKIEQRDDWFEVYRILPGVYSIREPGQAKEPPLTQAQSASGCRVAPASPGFATPVDFSSGEAGFSNSNAQSIAATGGTTTSSGADADPSRRNCVGDGSADCISWSRA